MTSKTLSVKLLKESIKRNMAFGALLTLIFFCYFPVGGMLYLRSFDPNFTLVKPEDLYIYGGNNPVLFVSTFASAVLMGILQFSYLHSREKVDFYHSFPVRREKIFGIQYLAGVIIWFIPYAVNNIFYLFLCMGKGAGVTGVKMAESLAAHLICFLIVYGCMIFAMMLTGKIFVAIAGMMVISVYIPGIRLLVEGLMSFHFSTYYGMTGLSQGGTAMKLSPVSVYYMVARDMMRGYAFPKELLLAVFLTALLIAVICLCIYKRRNSESAGSSMAFGAAARVIKFLIMVPCVLLGYVFFYGMSEESISWGIFGMILGLVIFSGLIEFVYTLDIREIFRDKGQILLTAVICLAIMAEFWFDLTGFDKWIPAENEVSSAEISVAGMSADAYRWVCEEYGTGENTQYEYKYALDKENIKIGEDQMGLVMDLVKNTGEMAGFEETADTGGSVYESGGTGNWYYIDEDHDIYRLWLQVTWNLKNGKTKIRDYSLSRRMWQEYFGKIWELPEVQETVCPVLNVEEEDVLAVIKNKSQFYSDAEWEETYISEDEEKFSGDTEELIKVLKEEIRNQKVKEPFKGYKDTLTVIYRDSDGVIYGETINLTDDFPQTKELLNKSGMKIDETD